MKKILLKILGLWNIYVGILGSVLIAWIFDFSRGAMDNITTFLLMTLVFMSTLTFIKWQVTNKKPNTLIEKAIMTNPTVRTINNAIDPMQSGQEIGQAILETTNMIERIEKKMWTKIKKFFKWVKTYWQQIVGLLGVFAEATIITYAYITDRFGWLLEYFPKTEGWEIGVKIGVGVIAVLFLFFQVRNQVVWRGVGSIAKATDFLQGLSMRAEAQLSPKTKANVKHALKTLKSHLKTLQKNYNTLVYKLDTIKEELASELELLNLVGGDNTKYNQLVQEKKQIELDISKIESAIHDSENNIKKYTSVLSVKIL